MRKKTIILALVIIINLFGSIPAAANDNSAAMAESRIYDMAKEIGVDEKDIDKYIDMYKDDGLMTADDKLMMDMVRYSSYLEWGDRELSFEEFIKNRPAPIMEADPMPETQDAQISMANSAAPLDPNSALVPEREVKDKSNYTSVKAAENIDYTTGELRYRETDLHLPGVNGLDFDLILQYDHLESAEGAPFAVPVNEHYWNTMMGSYVSEGQKRYQIGSGWSFAFPSISDPNESYYDGRFYIKLADGSVISTRYSFDTKKYTLYGRFVEGMTFEADGTKAPFILTYRDGKKDTFDERGSLVKTEDRYGNSINYFYTDEGVLSKVIDSAGRVIEFERQSNTVNICVNGKTVCGYFMSSEFENGKGRQVLYSKYARNGTRVFTYKLFESEMKYPATNMPDTTTLLALAEITYIGESNSISVYEYCASRMGITNEASSYGYKMVPSVTHRYEKGGQNEKDTIINETTYDYEYVYDAETSYSAYRITEETVQTGVKIEYDHYGNPLNRCKRINPDGTTVQTDYEYNIKDLITSYESVISKGDQSRTVSESYDYDDRGNLIRHTDEFGYDHTYEYDEKTNVLLQKTEPIVFRDMFTTLYTTNTLDEKGNIINTRIGIFSSEDCVQNVSYTYDEYGNPTSREITTGSTEKEYFEYTPDHANIKIYKQGDIIKGEYTYDVFGRMITEKDSLGRVKQYVYNRSDELVETINPDDTFKSQWNYYDVSYFTQQSVTLNENGPIEKKAYDDFGRVTDTYAMSLTEEELGYEHTCHYEDAADNDYYEVVYSEEWDHKKSFTYDSIGRVLTSVDADGVTEYEYDYFDRVVKITYPDNSEINIEYDDTAGTRITIDEEGHKTVELFDIAGRMIGKQIFPVDGEALTMTNEYDPDGRIIRTVDYNGNETKYEFDVLGRQVTTINALGERIETTYAEDSSCMVKTYPDGELCRGSYYDEFGRLKTVVDEYFNIESYEYDSVGNIVSYTDRNGQVTENEYNSRNMLISSRSGDLEYSYTYDKTGLVETIEKEDIDTSNKVWYNYNMRGLVLSEKTEKFRSDQTTVFTPQYDEADRLSSFISNDPQSQETEYIFSEKGYVTGISQSDNETEERNIGYTYYRNGLIKTEILPNGNTDHHYYDGANRCIATERTNSKGEFVARFDYSYDNNGNKTQIKETKTDGTSVVTQYEYDKLNRLKKEINGETGITTEYFFDVRNNIVQKDFSGNENYTDKFVYTSIKTEDGRNERVIERRRIENGIVTERTSYYLSPNGNTERKLVMKDGSNDPDEVTLYRYDSENMLVGAQITDGESGRRIEAEYYYDAAGRRQAKTVIEYEGIRKTGETTTEYYWYGEEVQYEQVTKAEGTDRKVNLWGLSGLAARNDEVYSTDGHGSVDAAYDGEEQIREYEYDAYGKELTENEGDENPYRYCSENTDKETGLIYLRNRYYDSELGRFLTEDPAQDGLNWYVYCGNNPVMRVDPWGMADVPKGGTEYIIDIIGLMMEIIGYKADYNNGDHISAPYLASEKRELLRENIDMTESYSHELAALVNDVVISGAGDLQEVSSVVAVFVELKDGITRGGYIEGQEVIPEEKIRTKYNYYVNTGNVYLAGDSKKTVLNKILPMSRYDDIVPSQQVFTGMSNWGYWIKILYYDVYRIGNGDVFNFETEDWWEDA